MKAAVGRFQVEPKVRQSTLFPVDLDDEKNFYRFPRPGLLWNGVEDPKLSPEGGQFRPGARKQEPKIQSSASPSSQKKVRS